MDFGSILISVAAVGGIALVIGILLSVLGHFLAVKTDARVAAVREALPGSNCGGCGLAGCDACAEAIVCGEAPVTACPVGGEACAQTIAAILGTEAEKTVKKTAFVHCSGTLSAAPVVANYSGAADCRAAALLGGVGRKCLFGCYGLGSCVKACAFDAIVVEDGCAKVLPDKCTACGQCVAACPQNLITLEPTDAVACVICSSHWKGKKTMEVCTAGCIGCGLCAKICPSQAIEMVDNLPVFDQEKCTRCGACAAKCPRHVIGR